MNRNIDDKYEKEPGYAGPTRRNLKSLLLCAGLGCTTEIAAALILGTILSFFPETAAGYLGHIDSQLSSGLLSIFVIIIFSPFFEEAVFRFLLLGIMERKIGFAAANIVQALIFGIYHMSLIQGIYAFLLGMLLGLLKHYTGMVAACICFHIMFNITGVLVNLYVPVDLGSRIGMVLMPVALAFSAALFILIRRNRCAAQTV